MITNNHPSIEELEAALAAINKFKWGYYAYEHDEYQKSSDIHYSDEEKAAVTEAIRHAIEVAIAVKRAEAMGGRMVAPEITPLMAAKGQSLYGFYHSAEPIFAAMHAAAPDLLKGQSHDQ